MRGFLPGLMTGLLVAILSVLIAIRVVPWWLERPPAVAAGTTLVLRLSGPVTEQEPSDFSPLAGEPSWTTLRLWDTLRKAAADPRIAALLLMPDKPGAGWAKLFEIRNSLLAFQKTGKPITAFLRAPNSRDFYLASAAGRIAVAPSDWIDLKGLRAELMYGRGALDKLGILPEFESIGRYKDGADILTRSSMRPETREVIESILDFRLQTLVDAIAQGRKKPSESIRGMLDQGPFLASEAHHAGLIDATEFEDQTRAALARQLNQKELKTVSAGDYQRVRASSLGLLGKQRIAFFAAEGDILRSAVPLLADHVLDPESFSKTVKEIRDDSQIKAVVLRIDSPGGDAIASDEMLRELKMLAEKKPVIVSMSDLAASGGYALAMGGHFVVSYPQTVTGSIGVFFGKLTLNGLYEKLGIQKEVITRGRFADIDSDVRPLSLEARQKLRHSLEEVYSAFVKQVSLARKRNYEEIDRIAQGRVWLGNQAKENGLVDELGGIDTAIELAKQRAGIPAEERIRLDIYPRKPDLLHALGDRLKLLAPLLQSRPSVSVPTVPVLWKRLAWDLEIH